MALLPCLRPDQLMIPPVAQWAVSSASAARAVVCRAEASTLRAVALFPQWLHANGQWVPAPMAATTTGTVSIFNSFVLPLLYMCFTTKLRAK